MRLVSVDCCFKGVSFHFLMGQKMIFSKWLMKQEDKYEMQVAITTAHHCCNMALF